MYLKESFDALSRDAEIKYVRPAVRVAQKYFEWTWSTPPLDTVSKRSYLGMFIAFICLHAFILFDRWLEHLYNLLWEDAFLEWT